RLSSLRCGADDAPGQPERRGERRLRTGSGIRRGVRLAAAEARAAAAAATAVAMATAQITPTAYPPSRSRARLGLEERLHAQNLHRIFGVGAAGGGDQPGWQAHCGLHGTPPLGSRRAPVAPTAAKAESRRTASPCPS